MTSSFRAMEVISREDSLFAVNEVSNIIKEIIERLIGGNGYQHNKINRWTADIVDQLLTELTNLDKPFKYIVQAVSDFIPRFIYLFFLLGDHGKEWSRFTYR
jgi:flagellar motor switch protein FliM